jgi:hypothetical protein
MAEYRPERDLVVGVFESSERARDAIEALRDAGFAARDIGVLLPSGEEVVTIGGHTKTGQGAATGAIAGGLLGGLGAWLAGLAALTIPGIGPFLATGAFATALGGAAIGAGVGAVAGALVGLGIPEAEARYYEAEVRAGRALVTVHAGARIAEARAILRRCGAYDVESGGGAAAAERATGSTTIL